MTLRTCLVGLAVALPASGMMAQMAQETFFLTAGVGIRGSVQIGDRRSQRSDWGPVTINNRQIPGLEFQTDGENRVIAIRCRLSRCTTDRGINVTAPEGNVLQRYGAPQTERKINNGVYYQYSGIGFELSNTKPRKVNTIYVFARAAPK